MSDVITVTASRAKVTTSDTDPVIQDRKENASAVILSSAMKKQLFGYKSVTAHLRGNVGT